MIGAILFYGAAYGLLAAGHYAYPGLLTMFQVVMWVMTVALLTIPLSIFAGSKDGIQAMQKARRKPYSGARHALFFALWIGLAVLTAIAGAPMLAAAMTILQFLMTAARSAVK